MKAGAKEDVNVRQDEDSWPGKRISEPLRRRVEPVLALAGLVINHFQVHIE